MRGRDCQRGVGVSSPLGRAGADDMARRPRAGPGRSSGVPDRRNQQLATGPAGCSRYSRKGVHPQGAGTARGQLLCAYPVRCGWLAESSPKTAPSIRRSFSTSL